MSFDKQHLKELEVSLFTKMDVKTEAYDKLLLICESLETIPSVLFEKFVEDCYQHFQKKKGVFKNDWNRARQNKFFRNASVIWEQGIRAIHLQEKKTKNEV